MVGLKITQSEVDSLDFCQRRETNRKVFGVAINDVDFEVKIGGSVIWQYSLWTGLLRRSFDERFKVKNPTYKDVTCCGEWLSFANFLEWVNKEVDYKGKPDGYQLDKDIIIKGNRVYCPEACSFVPQAVNKLLIDSGRCRGEWPVGVCFHKTSGKFYAQLRRNGVRKGLCYHETPEQAFAQYKIAKERHIKEMALLYKSKLKPAAFEALLNWVVYD